MMRFVIIFFFFTNSVFADQGIKISCVNMKSLLDKDPNIHQFKFDAISFQYFDEKKKRYIEIANKNLIIKENFFAARFSEYELGFQIHEFENGKKPIMSMSKYDYKNDLFLDHYFCHVKNIHIN